MIPHPDEKVTALNYAVITVSDTRTIETDKSGQIIQELLKDAGHNLAEYTIINDEPEQIKAWLFKLDLKLEIDAIIVNGGTGIAPRDTTYNVISS